MPADGVGTTAFDTPADTTPALSAEVPAAARAGIALSSDRSESRGTGRAAHQLDTPAMEGHVSGSELSEAQGTPSSVMTALLAAASHVSRGTARILTASDIAALPAPMNRGPDTPLATASELAVRARGTRRTSFPRPSRTRVIVVANQKGGVGKTTSAVNLSAALALYGARVLLVDLDPQGNASTALGVPHDVGVLSMYDAMVQGTPMAHVVQPATGVDGLWCAPATIDLSGAEVELVSVVARENRLRRVLTSYLGRPDLQGDDRYDYVFLDCPPSLGLITVNALTAAAEVLIPIQCEYYALEGFSQLLNIVELVKSQLNPVLDVSTVLLTMYDGRTRLASQVADEVRAHFGRTVLSTVIPRSVRVSEAPSYSQTVMTYDPGSSGALSYLEAARELAMRYELTVTSAREGQDPSTPYEQPGSQHRMPDLDLEETA